MRNKLYIMKGLLLLVAGIGLASCSKKSKSGDANNPVPPTPGPAPTGDVKPLYTHEDPTINGQTEFRIIEDDIYRPVIGGEPRLTGGRNKEGFHFTDNQEDNVIRTVRSALGQLNQQNQKMNFDFAQKLNISQVIVDAKNPSSIKVTYTYDLNGSTKYLEASGSLQNIFGHKTAQLQNTRTSNITVFARCLDEAGTCHNVLLKFAESSNLVAYGVFRTSDVNIRFFANNMFNFDVNVGFEDDGNGNFDFDIHVDQNQSDFQNRGMRRFYRLLRNSTEEDHGGGFNHHPRRRIKEVVLESATIINGSSTFSLFMQTEGRNNEKRMIPLFGQLLRRGGKGKHDVNVDLNDFKSIVLKDYSSQNYDELLNQITNVNLLQNNGKGSFQLAISFGADQHQSDRVILTISRTPVRIIEIPLYTL